MSRLDQATEIVGWRQRRLRGMNMTALQYLILDHLKQADDNDMPPQKFDWLDPRSVKNLLAQDWAVEIKHPVDGSLGYVITTRGLNALDLFSKDARRRDGLCPTCGKRERRTRRTGKLAPYCAVCEREMYHKRKALGLYPSKEGICSSCGERPKYVTPRGYVHSYCRECKNQKRRQEKHRANKRLIKRIAAGEVVVCRRCKSEPREVIGEWVNDYCGDCRRAYMREYNARRRGG